jgi:hypothetical protein
MGVGEVLFVYFDEAKEALVIIVVTRHALSHAWFCFENFNSKAL